MAYYIIMKTPKTCPRCGKVFLHRGNLNNHLRKQKICKITYINADREEIIKNYNKYEADYESLQQQKQKRVYKLKVKFKSTQKPDNDEDEDNNQINEEDNNQDNEEDNNLINMEQPNITIKLSKGIKFLD